MWNDELDKLVPQIWREYEWKWACSIDLENVQVESNLDSVKELKNYWNDSCNSEGCGWAEERRSMREIEVIKDCLQSVKSRSLLSCWQMPITWRALDWITFWKGQKAAAAPAITEKPYSMALQTNALYTALIWEWGRKYGFAKKNPRH